MLKSVQVLRRLMVRNKTAEIFLQGRRGNDWAIRLYSRQCHRFLRAKRALAPRLSAEFKRDRRISADRGRKFLRMAPARL